MHPNPSQNDNQFRDTDNERLLVLLAYGLFLIAPMGGFSALIGAVIAHIRLAHSAGTIHASHYRNQIIVFWTMLVCTLVALAGMSVAMGASMLSLLWPFGWPWHVMMLGAGWAMFLPLLGLCSLALVVWYYWRLIRGFVRELDDKPF